MRGQRAGAARSVPGQGARSCPGHMGRAGESRRWAWSPTRHRPSAMSSASASGLVGRDTHQRGDGQSGSSWGLGGGARGGCGSWEVGGSWQAGQCGLWRRIRWRPLASEVLASGLGPALHVPPPVLHFPTTFFVSRTPSFSKKNRQKIPLPPPVHRMTDRTCQVSPLSPLKRAGSSAQGAT